MSERENHIISKRRVIVLVDGYNLYHGICDLRKSRTSQWVNHCKWLNLPALFSLFLDNQHHQLVEIIYFTAYATWRTQAHQRHQVYVRALKHSGVRVVFGQFKERRRKCPSCGAEFKGHEEKETDVNLAIEMIHAAYSDLFDDLYIVSADTDLVGPIRYIKEHFPDKRIRVIFPPQRANHELRREAHRSSQVKAEHLSRSLFPAKISTSKGKTITRPPEYDPPKS